MSSPLDAIAQAGAATLVSAMVPDAWAGLRRIAGMAFQKAFPAHRSLDDPGALAPAPESAETVTPGTASSSTGASPGSTAQVNIASGHGTVFAVLRGDQHIH